MKNMINEIKNILGEINSRLEKEWISDLEDRVRESNQGEEVSRKILCKMRRDLGNSDFIKHNDISIIGIPQEVRKEGKN